jgi:hypothetical protein
MIDRATSLRLAALGRERRPAWAQEQLAAQEAEFQRDADWRKHRRQRPREGRCKEGNYVVGGRRKCTSRGCSTRACSGANSAFFNPLNAPAAIVSASADTSIFAVLTQGPHLTHPN